LSTGPSDISEARVSVVGVFCPKAGSFSLTPSFSKFSAARLQRAEKRKEGAADYDTDGTATRNYTRQSHQQAAPSENTCFFSSIG